MGESQMNNQHKINDVLQAMGNQQMSTKQIVPRLKELEITPRSLTYFMNEYMVNRYVDKERVSIRKSNDGYSSGSFIVKFKAICHACF